jgi:hypothetical protein
MTNTIEGHGMRRAAPAGPARPGRGRAGAPLLAVLALAVAACEGDNLFTGDGPEFLPRVLEIALPDAIIAGDTIRIRVDAAAARQIAEIVVSLRGAVNTDTTVTIDSPSRQLSRIIAIGVPAVLQDSLLRVRARVIDLAGVSSQTREVLVPAFGPPLVSSLTGPQGVRAGDLIALRVNAFAARRISRLDISARGAITRDTAVNVLPPRTSVAQDVMFQLPAVVQDTLITFTVVARDEAGFSSAPQSALVPFAIDTPFINVAVPPSVAAGSVLNLAVQARAIRQVTELRIQLLGDPTLPTQPISFPVSPNRVNVLEFLSIQLPGGISASQIQVRASALDRAGTISQTPLQTISVPTGAPTILGAVPFQTTVTAGEFVDVRVTAQGARPIDQIRVRWRGFSAAALAGLINGPESVINMTPPRTNVVADFSVEAPCVRSPALLLMLVTARDQAGELSPVVSQAVSVLGDMICPLPVDSIPIAPPDTGGAGPSRRVPVGSAFLGPASAAPDAGRAVDPALPGRSLQRRTNRRR